MHCCPHCQRTYSRKIYFDRHIGICEFLCKSKKAQILDIEERKDTPTVRDLYLVVMELVTKNKQLEEKVAELSKLGVGIKTQKKQQKIDLLDWLNMTYANAIDYTTWLNDTKVTRADLNILFETDYVGGIMSALKRQLLLDDEQRPLRAFDLKGSNTFYLFNGKKWTIMDNEAYLKLMHAYDKKSLIEFGNWQRENKDKMYLDDFSLTFNKNMKKIMITREPVYSRIKKELFSYLRTPAPDIP
jgi:hypothetical protein